MEKVEKISSKKKEGAKEKTVATQVRRRLREYVTEKDLQTIVKNAVKMAKEGDKKMVTFVVEQIFGKAKGTTIMEGGDEDKPIKMTFSQFFDSLEK